MLKERGQNQGPANQLSASVGLVVEKNRVRVETLRSG